MLSLALSLATSLRAMPTMPLTGELPGRFFHGYISWQHNLPLVGLAGCLVGGLPQCHRPLTTGGPTGRLMQVSLPTANTDYGR